MMVYRPIDERIQRTLFRRIDGLLRENPDANLDNALSTQLNLEQPGNPMQEVLIKSCWARAFSSLHVETVTRTDGTILAIPRKNEFRLSDYADDSVIDQPLSITEFARGGNLERRLPDNLMRPSAGITGIQSKTDNYKAITTTINWKLYDIEQFEIYKEAFLKHGRTILVEYGWNLPNRTNLIPFFNSEDMEKGNEFKRYFNNIQKKILDNGGNYNAAIGVVKNFNYVAGRNGEYDCTSEIISLGHNVLNTKKDVSATTISGMKTVKLTTDEGKPVEEKENTEDFEKRWEQSQKTFEKFLYTDENDATDLLKEFLTNQHNSGVKGIIHIQPKSTLKIKNDFYMSWGFIEDYIIFPFFGLMNDSNEPISALRSVELFDKGKLGGFFGEDTAKTISFEEDELIPTLCRNGDSTLRPQTLNLDVILPNQYADTQSPNLLPYYIHDEIQKDGDILPFDAFLKNSQPENATDTTMKAGDMVFCDKGVIRNFVFSLEFFREQFKKARDLKSAVQKLWSTVNSMYGGYWDFKVVQNEHHNGIMMIKDMRAQQEKVNTSNPFRRPGMKSTKDDPTKTFVFPNYSPKSLFKEFNVQVKLDGALAAAAMASTHTDVTKDGFTLSGDATDINLIGLSYFQNKFLNDTAGQGGGANFQDGITKGMTHPFIKGVYPKALTGITEDFVADETSEIPITIDIPDPNLDPQGGADGLENQQSGLIIRKSEFELSGRSNVVNEEPQSNAEDFPQNNQLEFGDIAPDAPTPPPQLNDVRYITNITPNSGTGRIGDLKPFYASRHLYKLNYDVKQLKSIDPIIPIEMSFTIQGISGLRVYDYFHVDYLPKTYQYYTNFMITNIEQEVSTNGWDTRVTAFVVADLEGLIDNSLSREEMPEVIEESPDPPPPQEKTEPIDQPPPKRKEEKKVVDPPIIEVEDPPIIKVEEKPAKPKDPPKKDRTVLKYGFFPIPHTYVFLEQDVNLFSGLPNGPYRTNNSRIVINNWDKIDGRTPVGGFSTPYKRWYEQEVPITNGGGYSDPSLPAVTGPRWLSNGWPEPGQYDKWDMAFYLRWGCFPKRWHEVEEGDTGSKLEKIYDIKWSDILRVNTEKGLNDGMTKNNIWVGMKIAVDWPDAPANPNLGIGVGDTSQRTRTNLEAGIQFQSGDYQ